VVRHCGGRSQFVRSHRADGRTGGRATLFTTVNVKLALAVVVVVVVVIAIITVYGVAYCTVTVVRFIY